MSNIDVWKIREDFPILKTKVRGKDLVYLDNAATTQKPQIVIDKLVQYYSEMNSNIHRGVHYLSELSTKEFEKARKIVKKFINANFDEEIIFTRGTTESINLVASSFGKKFINEGDEIIISAMEHHSNIVPWQMVCEERKAILKVIPMNDDAELMIDEFKKLISEKTKLVSIVHISNSLGTINPIRNIIKIAHQAGAKVLIDGAQSVQHLKVDVNNLDCDFFVLSGHKLYGPTGVGILYGKEVWLNKLQPFQGGGEMIATVTFEKTTYAELPHKLEAGTPNIEGGIVLGTAIDYLNEIGFENIAAYEQELLDYATSKLMQIEGLKIYGTATNKASVISFNVAEIHPYDIGTIIDKLGIAVRTGHHCAQPIMDYYSIPGTIRASFAFYNTKEEIDIFVDALNKAVSMLS